MGRTRCVEAVERWRGVNVWRAWDAWCRRADALREEAGMVERTLGHVRYIGVSKAFARWMEQSEEAIRIRELCRRAVSGMANTQQGRAVRQWASVAADLCEA